MTDLNSKCSGQGNQIYLFLTFSFKLKRYSNFPHRNEWDCIQTLGIFCETQNRHAIPTFSNAIMSTSAIWKRCFSLCGVDVGSWYAEMPREQIKVRLGGPALSSGRAQGVIPQYFVSRTCVVCESTTINNPKALAVCTQCQTGMTTESKCVSCVLSILRPPSLIPHLLA